MNKLLILTIAALALTGCTPDPVSKATDTLTLHYLNNKIYPLAVDCRNKEVDGDYYVLCTSVGGKTGGLYLIDYKDSGSYTIRTVNGKASQHASRGLAAMRFRGTVDIPRILASF